MSPSFAPDSERAAVGSVDDAAAKLAAPNRNRIRFGPSSPAPVAPVLAGRFDLPPMSRSRPILSSSSSTRLRFSERSGTNPRLPTPGPVPAAVAGTTVVVVVLLVTTDGVGVVAVAVVAVVVVVVVVVIVGGVEMVPAPEGGAVLAETSDSRSASSGSEDCSSSSPYSTSALIGGVRGRWIGVVGAGTGARCVPRPVRSGMLGGCWRLRLGRDWNRERGGERRVGRRVFGAGCGPGATPSSSSSSSPLK